MALQTEIDEFTIAWRALSGSGGADGWRAIPTTDAGPCSVFAARRFPGNEEAIIVGFPDARIPPASQLPQSRGFAVLEPEFEITGLSRSWIALARQPAGSLDLFLMMGRDVISVLMANSGVPDERLFSLFLRRVTAWQDFMQRERQGMLGPEAETGLFGELVIFGDILVADVPPLMVVNAWEGPVDGIQDFVFGPGAIEVKSTIAVDGFPAKIGCLEQLDDSHRQPLFVGAVRLAVAAAGETLPERIAHTRDQLEGSARDLFDSRLLHAGYLDVFEADYVRRFTLVTTAVHRVGDEFPRLTPPLVGPAIRSARYEIDLELVGGDVTNVAGALAELGAI